MERIMLKYSFQLENNAERQVTVNDVNAGITEQEIIALGEKLIEKEWLYKGSTFKSIKKCSKITIDEEIII